MHGHFEQIEQKANRQTNKKTNPMLLVITAKEREKKVKINTLKSGGWGGFETTTKLSFCQVSLR